MSKSRFPERVSLEYLKKIAKERLRELRATEPLSKLAAAQWAVARDYGFSSWRAMKVEVDRLQGGNLALYFEACAGGDADAVGRLLAMDASLAKTADPAAAHAGWTGLHSAARAGHLDVVRLLLESGADPNAREAGDHTYPLHWAVANRHVEMARALLDAGGDPHGAGDAHALDAIGWATYYHRPGREPGDDPAAAELLVERGARHHIFSAISLGDLDLIRKSAGRDPKALARRLSRFEHGLSALHFAIQRKRYDILDLLIELGADLEARDANGHTALETALLGRDQEAVQRLRAAGAAEPARIGSADIQVEMGKLAASVGKVVPMIYVPDVAAALAWYGSIGFKEIARFADDGIVNFGMVSFGKAEIMINGNGKRGEHDVSLWLYTSRIDDLYGLLKARQIAGDGGIYIVEHLNDTFYGARQCAIRDPDGYTLYFIQLLQS